MPDGTRSSAHASDPWESRNSSAPAINAARQAEASRVWTERRLHANRMSQAARLRTLIIASGGIDSTATLMAR